MFIRLYNTQLYSVSWVLFILIILQSVYYKDTKNIRQYFVHSIFTFILSHPTFTKCLLNIIIHFSNIADEKEMKFSYYVPSDW